MLNKASTFKVSICLLSFNHGHLIGGVIDSILRQTFTDYELIISDNCSEDNSWSIIQDYSARYPKIKAVRTSSNIGMAGNINFVTNFAIGEYLAILHHDDILDERLIESWVATAERTKAAFVFNEYLFEGVESHKSEGRNFTEKMNGKWFLLTHLLGGWGCPVRGTALIRRDCFNAIGGADLRFGMLSDVDLWMRLSARWPVGYVPEPLIEIIQDRPANYPKEYTGFSWTRLVILMNIHGNNVKRDIYDSDLAFRWYFLRFRLKVTFEVLKWITYGIVKSQKNIIFDVQESRTQYELFFLDIVRRALLFFYRNQAACGPKNP
jgi:glycosyltransferase involved in cell wall biosynthesis